MPRAIVENLVKCLVAGYLVCSHDFTVSDTKSYKPANVGCVTFHGLHESAHEEITLFLYYRNPFHFRLRQLTLVIGLEPARPLHDTPSQSAPTLDCINNISIIHQRTFNSMRDERPFV